MRNNIHVASIVLVVAVAVLLTHINGGAFGVKMFFLLHKSSNQ